MSAQIDLARKKAEENEMKKAKEKIKLELKNLKSQIKEKDEKIIKGGRMKKYILLSLIVILTIPGCSIFNRVNLNGTYKGTIQGTQDGWSISMSVDMTLNQVGDRVSGTWNTSGGTSGTLSGDIQGDNIKDFTIIQSNPCSGTFTGSAVIYDNGEEIRGNYHGTSCYGTVSATVEVFKQ